MTEDELKKNTVDCLLHALTQEGIRVEKHQRLQHNIPSSAGGMILTQVSSHTQCDPVTPDAVEPTGTQVDVYTLRKETSTSQFYMDISEDSVTISSHEYGPPTPPSGFATPSQTNIEYQSTLFINIMPLVRDALEVAVTAYRLYTYEQALLGVMKSTGYSRQFKLNSLDLD